MSTFPKPAKFQDAPGLWHYLDPVAHLPTRFAVVFFTAGVVVTFSACWMAGALYRRQIAETQGTRLAALAFQISDKLDRGMSERFREIQLAASSHAIRDPDATAQEKREALAIHVETLPDIAWVGIADTTGRIVAATRGHLEGTSVEGFDWFDSAQSRAAGGSLHTIPELANQLEGSAEEKPRFIAVASPIYALVNARPLGVLGAYVNWPWVRQTVASVVPEGATPDRISVTVYDLAGKVLHDSHAVSRMNLTEPLPMPAVPEGREYRGHMIEPTTDGDYITGYIRSRGHQGFRHLNWFFTVRQPAAAAYAPVAQLQRSILLVGLPLSLAIGVAGWFFALGFTRRLGAISAAADRIREGDTSSLVPDFKSEDETARMAESLGLLVQDLRDRNASLGDEVARLRKRIKDSENPPVTHSPLTAEEEARALNPVVRRPGPKRE